MDYSILYKFFGAFLIFVTMYPSARLISFIGKKRQIAGKKPRCKSICVVFTILLYIFSAAVSSVIVILMTTNSAEDVYYGAAVVPSIFLAIWSYHIICDGQCELRIFNNDLISYRQFAKQLCNDPSFCRIQFSSSNDREAEIVRRWDQLDKPASMNVQPLDNQRTKDSQSTHETSIDFRQNTDDEYVDPVTAHLDASLVRMANVMTLSPAQRMALDAIDNPPEIKYCRKCGSELPKGSRFCNKCGTKIKVIR